MHTRIPAGHSVCSPAKKHGAIVAKAACFGMLATLLLLAPLDQSDTAMATDAANPAPRQVYTTTDSTPGWVPSQRQETDTTNFASNYLDLIDQGKADAAYALEDDGLKKMESFMQFAQRTVQLNARSGPPKQRRILRVTWTKDPAHAPFPGVYAAVDYVAQYESMDRDCGYVIVYQKPEGGPFVIMRQEQSYMDNATAKKIEAAKSKQAVDDIWTQLSRNCPNYEQLH